MTYIIGYLIMKSYIFQPGVLGGLIGGIVGLCLNLFINKNFGIGYGLIFLPLGSIFGMIYDWRKINIGKFLFMIAFIILYYFAVSYKNMSLF